jgi:zinc transport system ATP-binding protein
MLLDFPETDIIAICTCNNITLCQMLNDRKPQVKMLHSPDTEHRNIRLKGAGVFRAGRWLVRGVDLSVAPREIVTVIGPNGSGKSTTAKLVLGILKPDEGEVIRPEGLRVGYVPQKLVVDWTMPLTVDRLLQLTGPVDEDRRAEVLDKVGIPHLAKAEVQHLSGGEFQRALLARAIVKQPDVLVLDEPVQGVDFSGEVQLYNLISQVRDETGCGIVLISHDLHLVMAATDKVICLNGHVCCHGTPQAVAESPEYRKLFGERGAATLAVYQHDHDHSHLPDGTVVHKHDYSHDQGEHR